jgi:ABC-type glycerol-3-phosphate transport system substrate-binding protein
MKIIAFKIAALAVLAATTACVATPPRDNSGADTSAGAAPTPLTCSYVIDGEIFTLSDGSAQRAITVEWP